MEGMGVKENASLSHPSLQEGLNPSCSSSCWPEIMMQKEICRFQPLSCGSREPPTCLSAFG